MVDERKMPTLLLSVIVLAILIMLIGRFWSQRCKNCLYPPKIRRVTLFKIVFSLSRSKVTADSMYLQVYTNHTREPGLGGARYHEVVICYDFE